MTHNRRSHAMDGLKLLFMLIIVVYHSGYFYDHFQRGYMAVELFFMISGYMLMRTLRNKPQLTTGAYYRNRLVKLYPHYLFSFLVMFLATSVYRAGTISWSMLLRSLPEMLMVQNLGIFPGGVNYPCWYLPVLVYGGMLVFFLGRSLSRKWFCILGTICSIAVYSFILSLTGGKMETFARVGIFYLPFWRGVAGLFCGAILYELHELLQNVFQKYSTAFRVIELSGLVGAIGLMFCHSVFDGPILISIFFLLLSVGSEKSILEQWSQCHFVSGAIQYEYAVFLNHAFVISMVGKVIVARFDPSPVLKLTILLVALVGYSIVTETLIQKGVNMFSKTRKKVKA